MLADVELYDGAIVFGQRHEDAIAYPEVGLAEMRFLGRFGKLKRQLSGSHTVHGPTNLQISLQTEPFSARTM
ncbi:hypothetical protein X734_14675 [Mesorhizobium sp. L2C084A000]|nr:hypothetical protein X734_14675 [Mesorhizobium sp. L2C084A000]